MPVSLGMKRMSAVCLHCWLPPACVVLQHHMLFQLGLVLELCGHFMRR